MEVKSKNRDNNYNYLVIIKNNKLSDIKSIILYLWALGKIIQ